MTHSAGVPRPSPSSVVTVGRRYLHGATCTASTEFQRSPEYVAESVGAELRGDLRRLHTLRPGSRREPRVSPFHRRQEELGAVFLEGAGWERPHWYEANAALLADLPAEWTPPQRDAWSAQFHSPIAAVEAWRTREAVAMYDMTPLKRLEVSGPGALALLDRLTTGKMDKSVGAVTYTLVLDEAGGIRSDWTVARLGPTGSGRPNVRSTSHLIGSCRPTAASRSATHRGTAHRVWSLSRDLVQPLSHETLERGPITAGAAARSRVPVRPCGCPTWARSAGDLHQRRARLRLLDVLLAAGRISVGPAGRRRQQPAPERGTGPGGHDMPTDHTLRAGLARGARDKAISRPAAIAELRPTHLPRLSCSPSTTAAASSGPRRLVAASCWLRPSAAFGHTIGRPIAYAWLPASAVPGTTVEIEYFGQRIPATVVTDPVVDPDMTRIRR